jgi:hypothetical protein
MESPFKDIYPYEYSGLRSYTAAEPQVKGYIEGYAAALADVMRYYTSDSSCGKHYDPMQISNGIMHSYAFDMKDGGRHHPLSDYKDVGDIKQTLLKEAVEWIDDK